MARPIYSGVGVELKAARERLGTSRAEFASRLRIREPYIGAIEEGRFADLPGPAYAAGFIRSYADSVGLDGEDCIYRFKQETAADADRTQLRFPAPEAESRLPGARLLAVSVLLVAGVYGGWYYLSNGDRSELELVPPVPERLLADDTVPAQADQRPLTTATGVASGDTGLASPNATPTTAVAAPMRTGGETRAAPERAEPAPPRIAEAREPAAAAAETTVRREPAPLSPRNEVAALAAPVASEADIGSAPVVAATAGSRVTLRARLDSWIQVSGEDDELLLTRILRAGDTYAVPNRPGLTLLTGNAGALEISVDGRVLPPIGPIGAVRRNVSLDPEDLLGGARRAEQ